MMVCRWLDADCVGGFASRTIAPACARHLAFLALVGPERPACRTSSDVRTLPLDAFREGCVQVLRSAGEAGMVQVGKVATDGTQRQGHASRHNAMSYGSMRQAVDRWRADIAALGTRAYQQDAEDAA